MNLVTSSHSGLFAEPPLSPTPLASAAEPPEAPAPAQAPPVAPAATAPVAPAETPSDRRADLPIEAQLVRMGLLTLEQLAEANRTRLENGGTVAEIALANGWVTAEQIAVLTGDSAVPAAPPAPVPVTEPVAEAPAPAPVADVFAPPPVTEPAPEPAPVLRVAEVEPVPAPAPAPVAEPALIESHPISLAAPAPVITFSVALRLTGGERLDVETGLDEATAKERAKALVGELSRLGGEEWPNYAGRFIRPETILSVDVFQDG